MLSEERSWNTTPFDKIWNKTIHPMMYRDPIVITPFDIKIGQYYWGIFLGIFGGAIGALALSLIFSSFMFGLRGPYFAIGSLGLAIATAEITITIDYVGGASGILMPLFPGEIENRSVFFYILCFF